MLGIDYVEQATPNPLDLWVRRRAAGGRRQWPLWRRAPGACRLLDREPGLLMVGRNDCRAGMMEAAQVLGVDQEHTWALRAQRAEPLDQLRRGDAVSVVGHHHQVTPPERSLQVRH